MRLREILHRLQLIGLHAEDEAVRRIRRRGATPRLDQVVAREGEQQHGGQAEREARHLHGIAARMAAQIGQAVAQRLAPAAHSAEQVQRAPCSQEIDDHGAGEATHDIGAKLRVAGLPNEEPGKERKPEPIRSGCATLEIAGLAPDHTQGGHVLQLQERRQREAEKQDQADQQPLQCGPCRRRRQIGADQFRERRADAELRRVADGSAERARDESEQTKFTRVQGEQPRLRRAEAAHHRAAVEMPLDEAPRAERDRHTREYRREERREREKAARTLHRRTNLGPAGFQRVDALAATELWLQFRFHRRDLRRCAGSVDVIRNAAARLHEAGRRHVGHIHHEARRDVEEVGVALGLEREDRRDAKLRSSEANGRADRRLQRAHQPLLEPNRARRWTALGGSIGRAGRHRNAQTPAQRIVLAYRLHAGELRVVAAQRHADEGDPLGGLHAGGAQLPQHFVAPRMVGGEDEIRAEQLVRVALERLADAVGEKADARHTGHRDDERRGEHAELARAPVPAQHAPRGFQGAILPATRRIARAQRAASASSCVTRTSVVPDSRLSPKSRSITPAPDWASRLPVGSSARRSFGRTTKARASATRCCSPPERCFG